MSIGSWMHLGGDLGKDELILRVFQATQVSMTLYLKIYFFKDKQSLTAIDVCFNLVDEMIT